MLIKWQDWQRSAYHLSIRRDNASIGLQGRGQSVFLSLWTGTQVCLSVLKYFGSVIFIYDIFKEANIRIKLTILVHSPEVEIWPWNERTKEAEVNMEARAQCRFPNNSLQLAEALVYLCLNCPLLLSHFILKWNTSINIGSIPRYEISRKSVEPFLKTEGHQKRAAQGYER